MYYCSRCKAELPAQARICAKCGYQRKPQQFVGPGFLPSRNQRPDTQHISEQQTQQISVEVVKGRPQLIQALDDFNEIEENFESYAATSQAAERWRTSWRNRQRSEAGPATSVSRGQSDVPEPLMAMQQSLARMRAIIAPSSRQNKQNVSFWITIVLMASLIIVLGAFIVSTYLPSPGTALTAGPPIPTAAPQPRLRMEGPQLVSISQGQMLHLRGENFDIGAPMIFLLDGTTAINGTNGLEISLLTSDEGTFDVAMPTAKWSIGVHLIQAKNNKNGQSAYLYIRISPPIRSIKRSNSSELRAAYGGSLIPV